MQVLGRVAGHQGELERGEPERGGHGVAPRHRRVVADEDQRHAVQRRPGDVDLAGEGELRLVEALRADPREMRVAEQQAAVVPGARGADRDSVAAHAAPLGPQRRGESAPGPGRGGSAGLRGGGSCLRRRRLRDPLDDGVTAAQQHELVEAQITVQQGDRLHPGLAAAGRVGHAGRAADVREVGVVALDVPRLHLHLGGRERLGQLLHHAGVDDLLVEQVGLQVAGDDPVAALDVDAVRPEVPGPLGLDRHVVVRHRAQVVLGEGVPVAEPEAGPAVREYVRDPAGGVPDLRGQLGLRRLGLRGPCPPAGQGWGSGDRHQGSHRCHDRCGTQPHHGLLVVTCGHYWTHRLIE